MDHPTVGASAARRVLLRDARALPLLPASLVSLLALDARAATYFDRVASLASHDPGLAARALGAANAAGVRGVEPILTLREAIIRLGAVHVAELVTSVAAVSVFLPLEGHERTLWRHAFQVAYGARNLAVATGAVDPGHAYAAGLLHDVGRFVIWRHDDALLAAVDAADWHDPDALLAAERDLCGIDHAALGAQVAAHWRLPEPIVQTIRDHHRVLPEPPSSAVDAVTWLVALADGATFGTAGSDGHSPRLAARDDDVDEPVAVAARHFEDRYAVPSDLAARMLRDGFAAADEAARGLGLVVEGGPSS